MTIAISPPRPEDDDELLDDSSALQGLRVLVVDDDRDTRELLDTVLTGSGVLVASAESVAEAFELVASQPPDVIISDIEMPDENGHSFLRNLRSVLEEDGGTIPAIALTGRSQPQDRAKGLASGFNLYLTKPTTPGALLRAVQTVAASVLRRRSAAIP